MPGRDAARRHGVRPARRGLEHRRQRPGPGRATPSRSATVGAAWPGRPVAGAGGVAAVGDQLAGCGRAAGGQPVVREQHVGGAGRRARARARPASASLVTVNAATGTTPDRVGPRPRPAQLGDQSVGLRGRPGVVPEQGRRTRRRPSSSATMPCCWPPTEIAATSSSVPPERPTSSAAATTRAGPPRCRRDAARRPARTSSPVSASTDHDLAGLGGGVDPGDDVCVMPSTVGRAHAGVARIGGAPGRTGRARSAACGPGPARRRTAEGLLHAEARLEAVELGPAARSAALSPNLSNHAWICGISARHSSGRHASACPRSARGSGPDRRCRGTPGSARGRSGSRPRRRVPSSRSMTHLSTR